MDTFIWLLMVMTFSGVGVILIMFGVRVFVDFREMGRLDGSKVFHNVIGFLVMLVCIGLGLLITVGVLQIKVKVF